MTKIAMTNIQTYERNLEYRLTELQKGDKAYELHQFAIQEAIIFVSDLKGESHQQRILDCGCGLGFTSAQLYELSEKVIGIDPSKKAIELAKKEHKYISFYQASAESFSNIMQELNLNLFDQGILNMVLHSVNDESVLNILKGVKKCLKPEGAIHIIVPTQKWLIRKLVEYAQDLEMERESGIEWVEDKIKQDKIEIPVKIRGGEYYPDSLIIYNRTLEDYGNMLRDVGFGVTLKKYINGTNDLGSTEILPFWKLFDYTMNCELKNKKRELLISFNLLENKI
jgi:SAM-dependent methyltransferase